MRLPEGIRDFHRGRVVGDVGMPGSGKTKDLSQIVGRYGGPTFALDTVGQLTRELEGADVWLVQVEQGFDLDETWDKTADWLNEGERVVWNLQSWMPEEIQELAEALVPRLKRARDIVVAVDEVQRIVPDFSSDNGRGSPRFKDWLTKRRNDGITFVWTSQRPAFVSMTLRGITDAWLVHRLFYHHDVEVIRTLLQRQQGIPLDSLLSDIQTLPPGEVLYIDLPFMA